jgi:multidrug efflux pump subunit AcrB
LGGSAAAPQLLTVEGVGSIDVSGGLVREVRVTLDQERLRSYGLAVTDVLSALRDQNQDVAAGNLTGPRYEIIGKTTGKFRTVDDIRAVLLPVGAGRRIPLSEVATVADRARQRVYGRLTACRRSHFGSKQPDANTVNVAGRWGQRGAAAPAGSFRRRRVSGDVQSVVLHRERRRRRAPAAILGACCDAAGPLLLGSIRKRW